MAAMALACRYPSGERRKTASPATASDMADEAGLTITAPSAVAGPAMAATGALVVGPMNSSGPAPPPNAALYDSTGAERSNSWTDRRIENDFVAFRL